MAATKGKPKAKGRGKPTAKAAAAKAPKPERRDGRYLRAARVIIAEGDGVNPAELAAKAGLSPASSAYCLEAFRGVTQALREAKLLPQRAAKPKAPRAPSAPQQAPEAAPANPAG